MGKQGGPASAFGMGGTCGKAQIWSTSSTFPHLRGLVRSFLATWMGNRLALTVRTVLRLPRKCSSTLEESARSLEGL